MMVTIEQLEQGVALTREQAQTITVTVFEEGERTTSTLFEVLDGVAGSWYDANSDGEDYEDGEEERLLAFNLAKYSTGQLIHFADTAGRDIEDVIYQLP